MMNNKTMQETIVDVMAARVSMLETDLVQAKMDFADITLDEGDYRCRDERKTNCKVIEGQIAVLHSMINQITSMRFEPKSVSLMPA